MSKPTFTPRGTIYDFSWKDEMIAIQVSRIKDHRDGSVKAQLTITTTKKGCNPHLYQAQFNMSAPQSRTTLVKIMSEKYAENNTNWGDILEQVCTLSVDQYREGEPVCVITTEDILPPMRYLIYPLIPEMQPTILYGDKSSLKSTMALLSYIAVSLPWIDNPLGLTTLEEPTVGLYLDWETEKTICGTKFQKLCHGMGLPYMELNYLRCVHSIADEIDTIQQRITETNTRFIIVDSLALACGGELNAAQAIDVFRTIRTLQVSSLVIAQNPKLEDKEHKTILGSTLFTYLARCIWEAKRGQSILEDNSYDVVLFQKYVNEDRLHLPMGYNINFYEKKDYMITVKTKLVEQTDLVSELSASIRIKDLLRKEGKMTLEKMVERLDIAKGTVRTNCYRLRDSGVLVRIENEWGLKAQELM